MTLSEELGLRRYTKRVPNRVMLTGNPFHEGTRFRDVTLSFVSILSAATSPGLSPEAVERPAGIEPSSTIPAGTVSAGDA